jgi:hypothetical protein
MNTTAQISERPTFGETLAELVPVIEFVPVAGPPVIFVLGPWLFLVLMLAAPFALVVALAVAAAVLAALAAAVVAIVAAPYLLVRHRRRASIAAPVTRVGAIESPQVAA